MTFLKFILLVGPLIIIILCPGGCAGGSGPGVREGEQGAGQGVREPHPGPAPAAPGQYSTAQRAHTAL